MILGVPCVDLHEVTARLAASLAATVTGPFRFVVVDNGSEEPYRAGEFGPLPFPVDVVRYPENMGYYYPLRDLWRTFPDALVALCHNDILFYERGWDERMGACFGADPQLGLVGLCGSSEADDRGGRGGGTMCFFRGERGQPQAAGLRITDLQPSVLLDSLFMAFRSDCVPLLEADMEEATWRRLPLAHFWDKVWPCRLIERGWRVATLGVEIDHWGGLTAVGLGRFRDDCARWWERQGVRLPDGADPGYEMYLEAERRFLGEYRDRKRLIPCKVGPGYAIVR